MKLKLNKHKLILKYIFLLLIPLGWFLLQLLPFLNSRVSDISSLHFFSVVEENANTLSGQRTTPLNKGDKVSGEFTAYENKLGIVLIKLNNSLNIHKGQIEFKLKEKNSPNWMFDQNYIFDQVQQNSYFSFGFPIISDSKGKKYQFELLSLSGEKDSKVALSNNEPQFAVVYSYHKTDLLHGNISVINFLYKKFLYAVTNISFNQIIYTLVLYYLLLAIIYYLINFWLRILIGFGKLISITNSTWERNRTLNTFLLIVILVMLLYWKAFWGYFQGDEWYYFTQIMPQTREFLGPLKIVYHSIADANQISSGAHLTPVSNLAFFLSAKFFTFTYWPYILSSLLIHITNSFIFYIFLLQFTNNKKLSLLASLFFAISYVHFQSITWAMTYLWTSLSVTFLLLSLHLLLLAITETKFYIRYSFLSGICLFLALLSKETTAIIFVLIAFILIAKRGFSKSNIYHAKFFTILLILYGLYRVALPKLISTIQHQAVTSNTITPLDPILAVFRLLTYPLKVLTEIFIPAPIILPFVEWLTPLAYPTYGLEKAVRGTSFLTFTQGAGSDMLIYVISIALLFLIGIGLYTTWIRDKKLFYIILFAFIIIAFSSFPLIFIATYAPWWGYVTFIDSRHLYIGSLGGGILFACAVIWIEDKLTGFAKSINRRYLVVIPFAGIIFLAWGILQFFLLQNQLGTEAAIAKQRKMILSKILTTVKNNNKIVVLVTSDTGYYGFGPIPPFQTNLGQILSLQLYQKGWLPEAFIKSNFVSKGGLAGEGYAEFDGKGFGYYVDENHLISAIRDLPIKNNDVYAYAWNGKNEKISDINNHIRKKLEDKRSEMSKYKNWKRISIKEANLSMLIPPKAMISEVKSNDPAILKTVSIKTPDSNTEITVRKRMLTIGGTEINYLKDSDGMLIGQNIYDVNIPMKRGDIINTKVTSSGSSMKYFIYSFDPEKFIEVTAIGEPSEINKSSKFTQELISLMDVKE